jgi:hypothetical protein
MITPLSIADVDKATDEEIVAAYVDEGASVEDARAMLAQLRSTDAAQSAD